MIELVPVPHPITGEQGVEHSLATHISTGVMLEISSH